LFSRYPEDKGTVKDKDSMSSVSGSAFRATHLPRCEKSPVLQEMGTANAEVVDKLWGTGVQVSSQPAHSPHDNKLESKSDPEINREGCVVILEPPAISRTQLEYLKIRLVTMLNIESNNLREN
jgi:hypothetical protein